MDINFETKTVQAFRECSRQIKRSQLSMESVVPDVNDDIGRLYAVQPSLLLKSKDLTTHGASVTGELSVALLYINELENAVFDLHLSQSFTLDFDMTEPDPNTLTQIRLFVGSAEARALNPRKVSVTVEVGGELSCYTEEACRVDSLVPALEQSGIYTRQEHTACTLINAVCEKTFVVNEQFPFSGGKPTPERLVSQKVDFRVNDRQLIGSKVLIKGNICVSVCYLSEEATYPITADFSAPFSQLIDIGEESMDSCAVRIEATSVYFSLIDTIGGEKALDAEIHAVAQVVSRFRQEVTYLSDAYSNRYPSTLNFDTWSMISLDPSERMVIESDERIELPEDCADVLSVISTLGQCTIGQGKAEAAVCFDILYRGSQGTLASARRMISASAACPSQPLNLCDVRLLDSYYRPDGNFLIGRTSIEVYYERREEREIESVASMSLDEDNPFDLMRIPTVTAVRADRESVWELARRYHSSTAQIEALNEIDGSIRGKMLLIPKVI